MTEAPEFRMLELRQPCGQWRSRHPELFVVVVLGLALEPLRILWIEYELQPLELWRCRGEALETTRERQPSQCLQTRA